MVTLAKFLNSNPVSAMSAATGRLVLLGSGQLTWNPKGGP